MICPKCGGTGVAEEIISYQMECRNHLFCFEDVPAPKCPDCGHYTITEETMSVMLAKVDRKSTRLNSSHLR